MIRERERERERQRALRQIDSKRKSSSTNPHNNVQSASRSGNYCIVSSSQLKTMTSTVDFVSNLPAHSYCPATWNCAASCFGVDHPRRPMKYLSANIARFIVLSSAIWRRENTLHIGQQRPASRPAPLYPPLAWKSASNVSEIMTTLAHSRPFEPSCTLITCCRLYFQQRCVIIPVCVCFVWTWLSASVVVSSTGFQLFCHNNMFYGLAVLLTESLTVFFQPIPLVPLVYSVVHSRVCLCVFWC